MTLKIEARLQEAAIVLAEELHFGRAAQRLHIVVSTLSKQIAELEDKLGTKLFERNSKGVQLTEPGRAFVENARSALLQGERAVLLARAAKELPFPRTSWNSWPTAKRIGSGGPSH